MRIDAHLHLWPSVEGYGWLDASLAPIDRGFDAAEGRSAIGAAGFDAAMLVQAADTDADTEHLLALAEAHDWIAGAVGWVPLEDPERAQERLDQLRGRPLVGVRALIHDQPDPHLLDRPEVRRTLALLAERELPLDVPDAWPHQLAAATRAAAEVDGLVVVLDHLGKPPVDAGARDAWRAGVRAFAAVPTTVAKVSGLHHAGRGLPADAFADAWRTALDAFGPGRMLLGSDWPMPLLADGLGPLMAPIDGVLSALSEDERRAIEAGTARRVYRLEEPC
ncbi:amidohydrolase family protein [Agrococcus sediminis]|uniref:amidohydrolase family protein n=1 Tax=Agrococcus sediminis TaxID=2599924 RepID=UPI001CEC436E|nr:amidohydrolase family protein [Agrococcus sediminis]